MFSYLQNLLGLLDESDEIYDSGPEEYYPSCPEDVYSAAWALKRFLPWELVKHTIDLAEYWQRIEAENDDGFAPITERRSPHICASLKIHTFNTRRVHAVRKVTFSIIAHDQGWVSDREGGNWTWFTASLKPAGDSHALEHRLATNPLASSEWHEHSLVWYADDAREDPAEGECSAPIMRLMEEDSWLQVAAHAKYGGWANHVRAVRIEAFIGVLH